MVSIRNRKHKIALWLVGTIYNGFCQKQKTQNSSLVSTMVSVRNRKHKIKMALWLVGTILQWFLSETEKIKLVGP
jgi:hypothetical protein